MLSFRRNLLSAERFAAFFLETWCSLARPLCPWLAFPETTSLTWRRPISARTQSFPSLRHFPLSCEVERSLHTTLSIPQHHLYHAFPRLQPLDAADARPLTQHAPPRHLAALPTADPAWGAVAFRCVRLTIRWASRPVVHRPGGLLRQRAAWDASPRVAPAALPWLWRRVRRVYAHASPTPVIPSSQLPPRLPLPVRLRRPALTYAKFVAYVLFRWTRP